MPQRPSARPESPTTRRAWLTRITALGLAGVGPWPALGAECPDAAALLSRVQTPPQRLPPEAPQLAPLLVDSAGRPIATQAQWEARRAELRRAWAEFIGEFGPRPEPPAWEVVAAETVHAPPTDAPVLRQLIRYESEPGVCVQAYLLLPPGCDERAPGPGILDLHSTTDLTIRQPAGVEGDFAQAFALRLAAAGYVTLAPPNFLWHETAGDYKARTAHALARHPGSRGMAQMLYDAQVALDLLANLPAVDPQRLGCIGHSLGSKEALYLAAFDERIQATVSSEGGLGLRFTNWNAPWYLGDAIDAPDFAREHHEVLSLVAPRAYLHLAGEAGPGAADGDRTWPFVAAALPIYDLYGAPRRIGLLNHRAGHSVPDEAWETLLAWFACFL